ncbi:hypothetical protein [Chryseobacterium sp. BIGb0232]|uniref:hypothetical protein n=1 Tax=Chryseobacterium sp. BIGb0232 TaxID=2940598 RepID=UPI0011CEC015|nr:hypothetical protein [Chryseobacterium sp. BIGb0232]MCS4305606.1 hypothetical protein [Chryseobacterium sp. BIGb0232]
MFAVANFYYYVFPNPLKRLKLFGLLLIIVSLLSVVVALSYSGEILEVFVTISGYYTLIFLAHLLTRNGFGIEKYPLYILIFLSISFIITIFYVALMQEIFNYS